MSERLRNLITVALIAVMAVALVVLVVTNPSDPDRIQSIGSRIKCPVCQGESIANSPSTMARDMLDLVAERVAEGRTDQEIINELLGSFSGAVLLDPPATGPTLVLWLTPVAALIFGVGVILWWRRHPPQVTTAETDAGTRRLAPLMILAVAFGAIVVVAGFFLQDRGGPASGVAAIDTENLDDVSNETMEAVIAAHADHPQVDGMRLALAERYFQEGEFRTAFPHFLAVADSPIASDSQVVTALVRLAWMAWEGNDEVDAAIGLLDQALAIDDGSAPALYLKGQVLWCGSNAFEESAGLFQQILADPELPDESRQTVQDDLDAVNAGTACT
jgi:cytochrome c-type biogenesis protein CcmH